MPKRKLRLWYNKNDYVKERENEKKLPEPIQSDNASESTFKDEMTEPTGIDNNIPQVESGEVLPVKDETKLPQAEAQNEILPTDIRATSQQVEIPPAPAYTQVQVSDNNNQAQTEPNTEPAPKANENTEATPTQTNGKTPEILTTEPEKQTLIQTEKPTTTNESPVQAIEEPSQPENKGIAAETTNPPPPVEGIKEEAPVETENKVPLTDSVVNIEKYTDSLKRLLPTKAVVCIGEYPINIILKGSFENKKDKGVLPIFVEKSTKDVIKWSQGRLDQNNIVCLDEDIDTHFWYDILPYVADNENFFAKIKSKPIEKLQGAIIVSSTWSGIGSALLPSLNTQFKEWNINSIALPILPSKAQPLDGQFNTFASIGILASRGATLLLVDRDNLENYKGIDRNGFAIEGNTIVNYLLDLMLAKENFVQELCELSKSFDSKMFTAFLASGVSLKIYDSIENMLNTTLLRPLFTFALSSATLLYVLIRMPFHLKEKLPSEKIDSAIANWFKDKANLESIYISDPVYVEDSGDRIDIAMIVGGFETAKRFAELEKRVTKMMNQAVKKGSITEEDWQAIAKSLL